MQNGTENSSADWRIIGCNRMVLRTFRIFTPPHSVCACMVIVLSLVCLIYKQAWAHTALLLRTISLFFVLCWYYFHKLFCTFFCKLFLIFTCYTFGALCYLTAEQFISISACGVCLLGKYLWIIESKLESRNNRSNNEIIMNNSIKLFSDNKLIMM